MKKRKLRSKKGMTLVEIIIGVAIIVIVFAGTLGAMVSGYTTTVKNADQNQVDAENKALNEILMDTIKKLDFSDADDAAACVSALENSGALESSGADNNATAIKTVAEKKCSGIKYVKSGDFPDENIDYQYTLITDQSPKANSKDIPGVIIKTAMKSSAGWVINQSFVPYSG